MNINHLKYVVEVENTGSITRAAQNLFMGQPNLSNAIKELEQSIGITIFIRTSKGVTPTPEGAEFLGYAKTILSQIDELESLYKNPGGKSIDVTLGYSQISYLSFIAQKLAEEINESHPKNKISLTLQEGDPVNIINDVFTGNCAVGVIRCKEIYNEYFTKLIKSKDLLLDEIYKFSPVIIISRENSLAELDEIPYQMLSGMFEVTSKKTLTSVIEFSKIKKNAFLPSPQKSIGCTDYSTIVNLVAHMPESYMWAAPVGEEYAKKLGIVCKKCNVANMLCRDIVIYKNDETAKKYADTIAKSVKEYTAEFDK